MFFHQGTTFAAWHGDAIIGGLKRRSPIMLYFSGDTVDVFQEIPIAVRIRNVIMLPMARSGQ